MSILSSIFDTLEQRVLHVPNNDVPMVVEAYNADAEVTTHGAPDITADDWRRFERIQALYTTHRIQRQATPQNPLLSGIVGKAIGGK